MIGGMFSSSDEDARNIILLAFDVRNSRRKAAHRVLKQVLSLASQRGYKNSETFISYFQSCFSF